MEKPTPAPADQPGAPAARNAEPVQHESNTERTGKLKIRARKKVLFLDKSASKLKMALNKCIRYFLVLPEGQAFRRVEALSFSGGYLRAGPAGLKASS